MTSVAAYAQAFAEMQASQTVEQAAPIFCRYIEGAGAADAEERRTADATLFTVAITEHEEFFALAA